MNTLALGDDWDLVIRDGTLAVNTGGAALAQDVASAVMTFRGSCWYDSRRGVPYFQNILGYRVSLQYVKQAIVAEGMTVPGVAAIQCFLTGPGSNRTLGGQLQIYSTTGQFSVAQTTNLFGIAPWWVSGTSTEAVEFST